MAKTGKSTNSSSPTVLFHTYIKFTPFTFNSGHLARRYEKYKYKRVYKHSACITKTLLWPEYRSLVPNTIPDVWSERLDPRTILLMYVSEISYLRRILCSLAISFDQVVLE